MQLLNKTSRLKDFKSEGFFGENNVTFSMVSGQLPHRLGLGFGLGLGLDIGLGQFSSGAIQFPFIFNWLIPIGVVYDNFFCPLNFESLLL